MPSDDSIVTLYETPDGRLSFDPVPGASEVRAELSEGYRVGENLAGQTRVFGPPGTLGMSADDAADRGALCILRR